MDFNMALLNNQGLNITFDVMAQYAVGPCDLWIYIFQGFYTDPRAIRVWSQFQWSNSEVHDLKSTRNKPNNKLQQRVHRVQNSSTIRIGKVVCSVDCTGIFS